MTDQTTQRVDVKTAAALTGLSPYQIRRGIQIGRFQGFQVSRKGKYIVDLQQLACVLATEAQEEMRNEVQEETVTYCIHEPNVVCGPFACLGCDQEDRQKGVSQC